VLIDSGCGIAPLRPLVESLTRRPLMVVNTHAHFDHIGGNAEFEEIAIHELGAAELERGVSPAMLDGYDRYARAMTQAYARYQALDARFFHLLRDAHAIRRWPRWPDGDRWTIEPTRATETLRDGDVVELGARTLRVHHTPGHSPDSICLELAGEGLLFGGDTVSTGPLYVHRPESSVTDLADSLARLAADDRHRRILCAHFLRTELDHGELERQVAALDRLLAGDVTLTSACDSLAQPALQARFDGFSFLVPETWAPQSRPLATTPAESRAA
jgi:glyoxylase-like metal-dependent hydrolase (beta-lactamase superfamily II)